MAARKLEALLDAAEEGVAFDGLYARRGADDYDRVDGYAFGTPEGEWTRLGEREFLERAAAHPLYVHDWFHWTRETDESARGRRAFLRWVEGAGERSVPERYRAMAGDGLSRTWGELRIEVTLDDEGRRRYDVRHEDDADAPIAELETHREPSAAREFTKYGDDGRYRPLRTAPTLPTGWVYPRLDGREAAEVVDAVYPATVANWHREREGDLDVTHWDETAERQTGIYDVVDELDEEAVNWIAESCCVDSQCLKRREWDKNEATELDPPRGDGEFPCREPCSLVVAAARKWATLEREESRTYEFELTPSEKEQIEEIVDAVADGRADEIREADVDEGANRYRARFLRAKRFDEDGALSGTPTEDGEADAESET